MRWRGEGKDGEGKEEQKLREGWERNKDGNSL